MVNTNKFDGKWLNTMVARGPKRFAMVLAGNENVWKVPMTKRTRVVPVGSRRRWLTARAQLRVPQSAARRRDGVVAAEVTRTRRGHTFRSEHRLLE